MNTHTHDPATIDPTATYAVFYVRNLRTRETFQSGIVSGEQLTGMITRSADPRRIVWTEVTR